MNRYVIMLSVYQSSPARCAQMAVCVCKDTEAEARRHAVESTIKAGLWVRSIDSVTVEQKDTSR